MGYVRERPLLGPGNIVGPRPEAGPELVRPFVDGLEDHAPAFATNHNLALTVSEPTLLRQTDCLTTTVLKQLGTRLFHA